MERVGNQSSDQAIATLLFGLISLYPYLNRKRGAPGTTRVSSQSPPTLPSLPSNSALPKISPPLEIQLSSFGIVNEDEIEVLLHNVSHTDMVMAIHDSLRVREGESIIARPKFSCFREISTKIEKSIGEVPLENLHTVKHPVYSRETNVLHPLIRSLTTNQYLDVGFDLLNWGVVIDNIDQLRFRQNDRDKISRQGGSQISLSAVYFPLLSMLIPKWLNEVESRGKKNSRKIVFLISGQGTPRDETARVQDNSTEVTAMVMAMFLRKVYPALEIVLVPSPTINLFRYADNIIFVNRILKPKLDTIRNELAAKIGAKWLENLHVTMSFADGSSARISAISAAIRPYRPSYMHFWQLKTFWYESKVCIDDIECHSYDEISTSPPMQIANVDDRVKLVVEEMLKFKEEFIKIRELGVGEQDMASFWLRKTKKPVLAVLLVQKNGTNQPARLFRGTNMEVSMPTGSLCAERNVIGSALAADLTLRREDIQCVAVLSLSLEPPSVPLVCSDCFPQESIESQSQFETRDSLTIPFECEPLIQQTSTSSEPRSSPLYSPSTTPSRPADMKRAMSQPIVPSYNSGTNSGSGSSTPNKTRFVKVFDVPRQSHLFTPGGEFRKEKESEIDDVGQLQGSQTVDESPRPRTGRDSIRQFPQSRIAVEESMNPLKPCGACHEWLKKIAEVNPSFSVITFTDSECKGVYVEQIVMM